MTYGNWCINDINNERSTYQTRLSGCFNQWWYFVEFEGIVPASPEPPRRSSRPSQNAEPGEFLEVCCLVNRWVMKLCYLNIVMELSACRNLLAVFF